MIHMKRNIILLFLVTLALGVLLGFIIDRYFIEGTERSQDNQEVSTALDVPQDIEVEPSQEISEVSDATNTEEILLTDFCTQLKERIADSEGFVITTAIAAGSIITSGDEISGCVYSINESYGGWAPFEGQVGSYSLLASDGTTLDEGPLSVVEDDWITLALSGEDIQYNTVMTFDPTGYTVGELILRNENASGEVDLDKTITISVSF